MSEVVKTIRFDALPCLHRTLDHLAAILQDPGTTRDRALDKLENARCQLQAIERAIEKAPR
jgi:hypothetical protein